MKRVIIGVAGTEGQKEYRDVQLLPGTKARDVLAKLELNGFQLSKPEPEGGMLHFNDNIYDAVADGQKLFATPAKVEAGAESIAAS